MHGLDHSFGGQHFENTHIRTIFGRLSQRLRKIITTVKNTLSTGWKAHSEKTVSAI